MRMTGYGNPAPVNAGLAAERRRNRRELAAFGNGAEHPAIAQMLQQIVDDKIAHGAPGFDCRASDMRRQHNVLHAEKSFRNIRLILEHIKTCGAEPSIF